MEVDNHLSNHNDQLQDKVNVENPGGGTSNEVPGPMGRVTRSGRRVNPPSYLSEYEVRLE